MKAYDNCYELKGLIWVSGPNSNVCVCVCWQGGAGSSHTTPSNSRTPVWCLGIQINSDPLPRYRVRFQRLRAQSYKTLPCAPPPLPHFRCQRQAHAVVACASDPLPINWRFQWSSPIRMPITSPGCYLYFRPTGYKSEVPTKLLLGFN